MTVCYMSVPYTDSQHLYTTALLRSSEPVSFITLTYEVFILESQMGTVEVNLRIPTLFGVKGQVALIMGGGSGLGTMIATALLQNGAKVYISLRKEKQLKEVSRVLSKSRIAAHVKS